MLSVVIPAHREEKRIGIPLKRLSSYLRKNRVPSEILVVTDPEDATATVAKKTCPKARILVAKKRQGKGAAIQRGLRATRGSSALLVYDADGATPAGEIGPALKRLKDADVVIGVRTRVRRPWYRRITTALFHLITQGLYGLSFSDTQCGFKLMRADKTKKIIARIQSKGLAWDVEFLWRCRTADLRVAQMPVRWTDVPGGPLESQKFRSVLTLLWDVLALRATL